MATEHGRRSLEGRCAVVTGVGSGLGQAIAGEFAAEGALVVGCDVNDAAGEATMAGIGTYVHADVSREAEVEGLIAAAVERHGRLHVMVNNAAVQIEQELVETTEEQLDRILAVNLKGVFFGCKHAVRAMRPAGGGAIVNIASILGLVGDGAPPGNASSHPPGQWSSKFACSSARCGSTRGECHRTSRSPRLSTRRRIFPPSSGITSTAIRRFSSRITRRPL